MQKHSNQVQLMNLHERVVTKYDAVPFNILSHNVTQQKRSGVEYLVSRQNLWPHTGRV